MNPEKRTKLEDYIADIKHLRGRRAFPIGAVLFDEPLRAEILDVLSESQILALECHGYHPDIILWHLLETLETGQVVALNVREAIDPKIMNQLHLLTEGQVNIELPWSHEPKRLVKLPEMAKVLLLLPTQQFDDSAELQSLVTAICRLQIVFK